MKKVCIVTASRSEYGLLRWVIDEFHKDNNIDLQLIVTGSHLSPDQGMTINAIYDDGYPVTKTIEYLLASSTDTGIAKSMGICGVGFADALKELRPDVMVVLGDRYELLPICSSALIMNIPIAHIGGGDVTLGAIDDKIRNAITMMSTLHFPSVRPSFENIVRMRGTDKNVYLVGETGLDNYQRMTLKHREELSLELGLDIKKKWILVTLHPETSMSISQNVQLAYNMMDVLKTIPDTEIVVSAANTDLGGVEINNAIAKYEGIHRFKSLGQINYLSYMNQVVCVVGNSSSGILETPFLGTPTVNIGNRQSGRYISKNVYCCGNDRNSIFDSVKNAMNHGQFLSDHYFGDGQSSIKIYNHIKDYLDGKTA